jgi:hypothetical protein
MSSLIERALLAAHVLSSAAWFGALVYRAFFVDPAARRFFARGGDYEHFALQLADGMRYVVLAALLTCGLSGLGLLALRWPAPPRHLALMGGKAAVWAAALAVFAYISWVFWPRRVFAVEAEHAAIHRQGLALALVMIALAGLGILLGQLGRAAPVLRAS